MLVSEIYFWTILKSEQKKYLNINYFWTVFEEWKENGGERKLFLNDFKSKQKRLVNEIYFERF